MKRLKTFLLAGILVLTTTLNVIAYETQLTDDEQSLYNRIIESNEEIFSEGSIILSPDTDNLVISPIQIIDEDIMSNDIEEIMSKNLSKATLDDEAIVININGLPRFDEFNDIDEVETLIIDSESIEQTDNFDTIEVGELELSANAIIRAAYPDLTVSNLSYNSSYTNSSGTFDAYSLAGINFTVSNIGNAAAYNVRLDIIFDGQNMGAFNLGTIYANGSVSDVLEIGNVPAGTYSLSLVVDVNNTITESNENNNTRTRSFTWRSPSGLPDLVSSMTSEYNTILAGVEDTRIEFRVSNVGSTDITQSFPVYIFYGENFAGSITLNGLRAGRTTTGEFYLSSADDAYGEVTVVCMPNPSRTITESNHANNNSYADISVIANYIYRDYQTELLDWQQNYYNMSVRINNSLLNYYSGTYSNSQWINVVSGSSGWNGYNSNTRFLSPTLGGNFSVNTTNITHDVEVVGADLSNTTGDGWTYYFDTEDGFSRRFNYVEVHTGTYTTSGRNALVSLTHELGHVCGLSHPETYGLAEYSIMYCDGAPYEIHYITDADKLNMLYVR